MPRSTLFPYTTLFRSQIEPLNLRIGGSERPAQGEVQGVDGAIALTGYDDALATDVHFDGRFRIRVGGIAGDRVHDGAPGLGLEEVQARPVQLFAQEKVEGGVRGVEGVPLRLGGLDPLRDLGQELVLPREVDAEFLAL